MESNLKKYGFTKNEKGETIDKDGNKIVSIREIDFETALEHTKQSQKMARKIRRASKKMVRKCKK